MFLHEPAIRDEEIIRLKEVEGLTYAAIARRYGVSRQLIWARAQRYESRKAAGVPMPDKPAEMKRIREMFVNEGKTLHEIAEIIGITRPTLRYRLQVLGLIPPPQKREQKAARNAPS